MAGDARLITTWRSWSLACAMPSQVQFRIWLQVVSDFLGIQVYKQDLHWAAQSIPVGCIGPFGALGCFCQPWYYLCCKQAQPVPCCLHTGITVSGLRCWGFASSFMHGKMGNVPCAVQLSVKIVALPNEHAKENQDC